MTDGNRRTYEGRVGAMHDLIVDGLPPCTIAVTVDGIWHVVAQLASDEQAALAAAAPDPATLCQQAQHALGRACTPVLLRIRSVAEQCYLRSSSGMARRSPSWITAGRSASTSRKARIH